MLRVPVGCAVTRRRPRATASRCVRNSAPEGIAARTRASGTPVARAISRGEYMCHGQWQNPCREWLTAIFRFAGVSGVFLRRCAVGLCSTRDNLWPYEDLKSGAPRGATLVALCPLLIRLSLLPAHPAGLAGLPRWRSGAKGP